MRTAWNDAEDDALQGLPLRAQIIYLRGIRRYMDYRSRICGGPGRRISLTMLAETVQELVNRQIQPKASKDAIRAALAQLKRAGLIERLEDADYLLFYLPKADTDKSVPNHHPTSTPQPGTADQQPSCAAADAPNPGHWSATTQGQALNHHPTHQDSGTQVKNPLPDGSADLGIARAPAPPYQAIVSAYHECLPGLPRVYKLTDSRRRHIKALWADELDDLASWRHYFRHISRSDFLMGRCRGRDGTVFQASFDFIIHPAKFIKIAEEQYHAKKV
ncbi:hypothetical protein KEF85_05640 [Methylomonas paludis]|uniref:Uncharacterized protein n=1 Tax=Methylomonas paludis TaxID=1173101 RepID=A0A975MQI2_9GAMM|nr:hypothetical protein [Methylomonas paludis]QWF71940.1 hypothetical protein KEF85_05640 [Methylomonas paludis]